MGVRVPPFALNNLLNVEVVLEKNLISVSDSVQELELTYTPEEYKEEVGKELKKIQAKLQLPGFRKGKVPPHIIKKMYGDALEYEAAEKAANTLFFNVVEADKLNPVGTPSMTKFDFKPGENLKFTVRYETYPEVTPVNYTGNNIEIPDHKPADNILENEKNNLLKRFAGYTAAEVIDGTEYKINVDYTLRHEEKEDYAGASNNTDIDLSARDLFPAFKEEVIGKKVGDQIKFKYIYDIKDISDDPSKTYYEATIKSIEKISIPEFNEELITANTSYKSIAEWEEAVMAYHNDLADQKLKEAFYREADELLLEKNQFTVPHAPVHNYAYQLADDELKRAKERNQKLQLSRDRIAHLYEPYAERSLKLFMIRDAIIKKENITLTDEKIQEKAEKDAKMYNMPVEQLAEYHKANSVSALTNEIFYDFLYNGNNIIKIDPEEYAKKREEKDNRLAAEDAKKMEEHHHEHDHDHEHHHHDHE